MPAQALDRTRATPLWEQLLTDLRRRLDHDEFAVAFPGELALVAEYGVSRHTVREAVRRLREEGLVVAGRGRTPRRAEPLPIEQPLGEIYSLFTAVEATGRVQRSVVRTLDVRADGVVAARLGLEESTPLVHLERLRLADAEPLAVDRVWLPERLAAPLLDVDFGRTALYTEYAERVRGAGDGRQRADPGRGAGRRAARACSASGRGWRRSRSTGSGCAGEEPVEWRQTLVRADRFSVTARFSAQPTATGSAAPDALTDRVSPSSGIGDSPCTGVRTAPGVSRSSRGCGPGCRRGGGAPGRGRTPGAR